MAAYLQKMIESQDSPEVVRIFEEFILRSYGEISADGKYFRKSDEIRNDFLNSQAYNHIFVELTTTTDAMTAFVNGIMPKITEKRRKEIEKEMQEQKEKQEANGVGEEVV